MKAITLHQPWATLIAHKEKYIETRGWETKYRGEIAIHAGKKIDYEACEQPQIKEVLAKHGYDFKELPTGVVVATTSIFDCVQIVNGTYVPGYTIPRDEYVFGHFATGRYAWILTCTKALEKPVPAKGRQGLWNWRGKT